MLSVFWGAAAASGVLGIVCLSFAAQSHVLGRAGGCSPEFTVLPSLTVSPMLYASVRCGPYFDVKSKRALPPVLATGACGPTSKLGPLGGPPDLGRIDAGRRTPLGSQTAPPRLQQHVHRCSEPIQRSDHENRGRQNPSRPSGCDLRRDEARVLGCGRPAHAFSQRSTITSTPAAAPPRERGLANTKWLLRSKTRKTRPRRPTRPPPPPPRRKNPQRPRRANGCASPSACDP